MCWRAPISIVDTLPRMPTFAHMSAMTSTSCWSLTIVPVPAWTLTSMRRRAASNFLLAGSGWPGRARRGYRSRPAFSIISTEPGSQNRTRMEAA
jgi:hypothetical protein